jgi:hypothetical protein
VKDERTNTCETCIYYYHIKDTDVFYCDFLKRNYSKEDNIPCNSYSDIKEKTIENKEINI